MKLQEPAHREVRNFRYLNVTLFKTFEFIKAVPLFINIKHIYQIKLFEYRVDKISLKMLAELN